ncbi:DUF2721 domain-containing protein [Paracnuella aquatica]|uniref:DUF2721 domain-containing protein n=1 Tax=Paracnuella aquatica TaxID=2268757 RepID=UPI000DEF231E|nr:DUF2721 domain-containing protein [Paracnuella aquatica]RPD47496.1 DUF2721 domain-containing protein [Paracnuella aquatica]
MELTFNTPALLFPAISLLLLAYTNRFVAIANRVRNLHSEYLKVENKQTILQQIRSLRKRINLIKYMQGLGVFSFLCCVVSMYCIYNGWNAAAQVIFTISLLSLLTSLFLSLLEIIQSTYALELELGDIEELEKGNIFTDLWKRE